MARFDRVTKAWSIALAMMLVGFFAGGVLLPLSLVALTYAIVMTVLLWPPKWLEGRRRSD